MTVLAAAARACGKLIRSSGARSVQADAVELADGLVDGEQRLHLPATPGAPLAEIRHCPSTGRDLGRPRIPASSCAATVNQAILTGMRRRGLRATAPFAGTIVGARAAVITVAPLISGNVPGGLRWRYNAS